MKTKMKSSLGKLFILALAAASAGANASDITSDAADLYIRVTRNGQMRKFEMCSRSEGEASCHRLGYRDWYKVSDLEHQRKIEQWQAAGSTLGAAAVTALGLLGGAVVVSMAAPTAVGALATSAQIGSVAAAGGGAGVAASIVKIGPVEQFKQQYLLRSEVVNDEEVRLDGKDDRDIQDIAFRLEGLLHKLD